MSSDNLIPRKRTLTDADLVALAELLQTHSKCTLGLKPEVAEALNNLTPEELGMFKRGMRIIGNAANIVGATILVFMIGALIAIFTKGFWISLLTGIKAASK